jgi:hypothetical protein
MTLMNSISTRKKIGLVSLALLAVLLASGALTTSGAASFASASSTTTTSNQTLSSPMTTSTQNLPSSTPTFVGNAGSFLSGPFYVSSAFSGPASGSSGSSGVNAASHPLTSGNDGPVATPKDTPQSPPSVNCKSSSSGCDTVSTSSGGATTNLFALNSVDSFNIGTLPFQYTIEPPDQGLCASNQYVVEVLNIGQLQVYDPTTLKAVSGVVSLQNLMGLASMPPLGWSSGGDIQCQYDYANGGHWFFTEFVSTTPEAPLVPGGQPGPFQGCFAVGAAAQFDTCREGIAVSVTNNPMGAYNVYFLDPNAVSNNHDPGKGFLLDDYVKTATTQDAFLLFYDEYIESNTAGYGSFGFNGAQQLAFSKTALEMGSPASSVNVAYENMGTASNLYPIHADGVFQPKSETCDSEGPGAGLCWYQVIPAQTPDPTQYDNNNGGTGFMVGSLDFLGAGDNRIAVFDWTGLCNLDSACLTPTSIKFGGQVLTTGVVYQDEGAACLATTGSKIIPSVDCGLGQQKAGPIPLGASCVAHALNGSKVKSCPENGIATNGDGATQSSYADGQLWAAVATQIVQTSGSSSKTHIGATYWAISAVSTTFSVANEGYVTAAGADMEFASIAATDAGQALMTFTLSGADYYPSTAYTWLTMSTGVIHITAMGKSPQDGFTEYQGYTSTFGTLTTRPRWGDYSAAIFVPSMGSGGGGQGKIYFATEYIQSPNCAKLPIANTLACGGTRTTNSNWGSSVNYVSTT